MKFTVVLAMFLLSTSALASAWTGFPVGAFCDTTASQPESIHVALVGKSATLSGARTTKYNCEKVIFFQTDRCTSTFCRMEAAEYLCVQTTNGGTATPGHLIIRKGYRGPDDLSIYDRLDLTSHALAICSGF